MVSSKQIIAVDIDDVLVPHFQDLVDWYNAEYDATISLADNKPEHTPQWKTDTVEEAIRRVHRFYDTQEFRNAKPFNEAIEVLKKLAERYDLAVVTARDTIIEKVTRDWLNEHFAELFTEVHFTARFSLEGKSRRKVDICREMSAAYLIDDDIRHILLAHEAGINCILFADYPWSQNVDLPAGVTRCKDWVAVEAYFAKR